MSHQSTLIVRRCHIVRSTCISCVLWLLLASVPGRALAGGPPCPGSVNGDGMVDVNDLLMVISSWGACPTPCPRSCTADIDPVAGNCVVDVNDLLVVITSWGACPTCPGTLTWCQGSCRDLANDPTYCGTTCENAVVCGQFETCTGGVCVPVGSPPPPQ